MTRHLPDLPSELAIGDSRRPAQPDNSSEERKDMITESNLVSRWNEYGDVVDNAIKEASLGSNIRIGARFSPQIVNNTIHFVTRSRVFNSDGLCVSVTEDLGTYPVENNTDYSWEAYHSHNSGGWDTGKYTAEFVVWDINQKMTSVPAEINFTLVGNVGPV